MGGCLFACGVDPGDFLAHQHRHRGVHRTRRGHYATFGHGGVEVGQLAHWQPYRLRLLVACGAAAGMAAAYNAPITGAIFAAHIVLGNFSMNLFAPLLCSSVVATMVSRSFFGIELWYEVPNFDFTSIAQLPWFLVLGFLAGVLGAVFLKLLRVSQEAFQADSDAAGAHGHGRACWWGSSRWAIPEVWGNGYVIDQQHHPTSDRRTNGVARNFSGQIAGHRGHGRVRARWAG